MRTLKATFLFFLVLGGTFLIAAEPPANPEIQAVLQPFVDSHEIGGIITLVATKDGILAQNVMGYADIAADKKMKADNLFWIASMSKPVAGTAVMMLVEEGKIALDDPVTKYIPELAAWKVIAEKSDDRLVLVAPEKPVTVRQLLSHTSGLAFLAEVQHKFGLASIPLSFTAMPSITGPLTAQPGTTYLYSNQGINVAARIVEIAAGMPYEEFLQKRLFDPLEMIDTTFWPNDEQLARLVKTYRTNKNKDGMDEIPIGFFKQPLSDRQSRYAEAGGGLFSTTADVYRFCRMIADGGTWNGKRFLSPESIREMGRDQTGDLKRHYGLGWGAGGNIMGHGGAQGTQMKIGDNGAILIFMIQGAGEATGKADKAFTEAALKVLTTP